MKIKFAIEQIVEVPDDLSEADIDEIIQKGAIDRPYIWCLENEDLFFNNMEDY